MTAAPEATTIELLAPGQEAEWDAFVDSHSEATVYHASAWRDIAKRIFGHDSYYLAARNGQREIVGILPLVRLRSRLFGDFCVSLPYVNYGGAVARSTEVAEALMHRAVAMAEQLGSRHIEFRDMRTRVSQWPVRTDKVIMELALPESAAALWARFDGKLRAQIRRPTKEGAVAAVGRAELLPEFYRVFARNMRDLGTPVYPRQFFSRILETHEASAIAVVRLRDEPVAAGFLLGFRERLEIPWASSVGSHNRLGVNMLLYWEALQVAIDRGYRIFDFGRSSVGGGTYRFKAQWGAEPRQTYWHYWMRDGRSLPQLNPSNPKYRMAILAWQHLPLAIANRIGPMIVGNLP